MLNIAEEFFCGCVAGVASCVSGYFLDTLKVRMQMDPTLEMWKSLKEAVKQGKTMQLFDGMLFPFMTVPVINAISFGCYKTHKGEQKELSIVNGMKSGAFAGLMVSFVVSPVELIKCRMQLNYLQHSTSTKCLQQLLKTQGFFGLFRGYTSTLCREVLSFSTQFAIYQCMKRKFVGVDRDHLSLFEAIAVGGVAAFSAQLIPYPIDVVKTHVQVNNKQDSAWTVGKQIFRKHGVKGFATGIKPCLLRATLADGLGIVIYEKCHHLMSMRN